MLSKNGDFTPTLEVFHYLNQTSNQIRPLKKDRYVFYLSYDTLMTNVPVLGAEQFQFPWRVIFGDFCSNWFKLVSSNPPDSQAPNQKRKLFFTVFNIERLKISFTFDLIMATLLKDTRRQLCVWSGCCKNSISKSWKA